MLSGQAVGRNGVGLVLGDEHGDRGAVLYCKGFLERNAGIGRAVAFYLGQATEKVESHAPVHCCSF